jgi:uncharacterized protein
VPGCRGRPSPAADEPAGSTTVSLRLPSHLAGLDELPFEDLDPADMHLLGRWLAEVAPGWPRRRTRRLRPSPAGHRVALRPTLALARRTGWEPIQLVRVGPGTRPVGC